MFGWCGGSISVESNGPRAIHEYVREGTLRITGVDNPYRQPGKKIERIVRFADCRVVESILKEEGKTVHHIEYGRFERSLGPAGLEITRFCKDGKSKHGKARRLEKLFGHDGVCHSWYASGRLIRQRFVYDNRRVAYDFHNFNAVRSSAAVRGFDGETLYVISGVVDGRQNMMGMGTAVLAKQMLSWFHERAPFEVRNGNGKILLQGRIENRQRVGEWVENGRKYFYERGVAIPAALYRTPPEKLDPAKILRLPNAQARMALMAKIGPDRIAKIGKVIHKDGDMRLFSVKGFDVNILRVKCPSTGMFYFLRVPKDATKCEEARQWTFHVGDGIPKEIKFAVET